ncbi:MAG: hypothetical protein KAH23_06685 [Kiritimatiellae bacterium]|nr:hypothetical protein [Kiritimatiellia bacterium]
MIKVFVLMIFATMMIGCSKSSTKKGAPEKPSMAEEFIDGATGRTAVRHGRKAMETIERIQKQETEDLNKVMGQ